MTELKAAISAKAKKIKVFAMDVDGVLTNGKLIFLESGEELKSWNVKDRIAFYILKRLGYGVCWISGRKSVTVQRVAEDMEIKGIYLGIKDKMKVWEKVKKKFGVEGNEILYIGDDLVDITLLKRAGIAVCPRDGAEEIKNLCDIISSVNGGDGVLRDAAEKILKAQGKWREAVDFYDL
ncbi:HAD hydrolase family protein [bacterium]|nr:3-deoxy-D-manno-octulosonate 8-phosphate phosphatase [bacterium]MBU3954922.1 HAD hydrolase family protein [bacterium]MBU4134700.1 HAD hydrolase family protein [bacterium]